jgi:phenylpropionate dioxygenase-like ring-hydroxylating dioxygenase large terminal subunit
LECAWTFDATGTCTHIPQWSSSSSSSQEASTTPVLPVCRLRTYPSMVENNIIRAWLWDDTDPFDESRETATKLNIPHAQRLPEYFLFDVPPNSTTYTRDVPYSYDTLLENIVDPAHVPFAHHSLQGTRHDAMPIVMSRPTNVTAAGFNFTFSDRTMRRRRSGIGIFRAPFVVQYAAEFEPPNEVETVGDTNSKRQRQSPRPLPARLTVFNLTTIQIPTRPGWSRIIIFGFSPPKDAVNATTENADGTIVVAATKKRKPSLFGIL